MSRTRTAAAFIAAALVLPIGLAACSSDSGSTAASASASATASESASGLVGGDPSTWSPTELTQADNGEELDWQVGQTAILTDLPATDATNEITLVSTNPTAVAVTQGDGTTTNPGFQAIAPGYALVIAYDGDPASKKALPIEQFTVLVTNDPNADGNPWNGDPAAITSKKITLQAGASAMWEALKFGKKIVVSKDGLVALPWTKDDGTVPGFTAVGVGKTVVKLKNAKGKVVAKVKVTVTP